MRVPRRDQIARRLTCLLGFCNLLPDDLALPARLFEHRENRAPLAVEAGERVELDRQIRAARVEARAHLIEPFAEQCGVKHQ